MDMVGAVAVFVQLVALPFNRRGRLTDTEPEECRWYSFFVEFALIGKAMQRW